MTFGHEGLVALGGFFGACARYGIGVWGKRKFQARLPVFTLFINLSGSFLLGIVAAAGGSEVSLLVGTGFMGAYTTFSTFNAENVQLWRSRAWRTLTVYVAGSYIFGVLLAWTGYALGSRL